MRLEHLLDITRLYSTLTAQSTPSTRCTSIITVTIIHISTVTSPRVGYLHLLGTIIAFLEFDHHFNFLIDSHRQRIYDNSKQLKNIIVFYLDSRYNIFHFTIFSILHVFCLDIFNLKNGTWFKIDI